MTPEKIIKNYRGRKWKKASCGKRPAKQYTRPADEHLQTLIQEERAGKALGLYIFCIISLLTVKVYNVLLPRAMWFSSTRNLKYSLNNIGYSGQNIYVCISIFEGKILHGSLSSDPSSGSLPQENNQKCRKLFMCKDVITMLLFI